MIKIDFDSKTGQIKFEPMGEQEKNEVQQNFINKTQSGEEGGSEGHTNKVENEVDLINKVMDEGEKVKANFDDASAPEGTVTNNGDPKTISA